MPSFTNYCCVCLSKNCTTKITDCDAGNVSIISKLESIVAEVKWEDAYKICSECLGRLSNVVEFKNLCVQTELIRNEEKTKLEVEVDLGVFEDDFSRENDAYSSSDEDLKKNVLTFECIQCNKLLPDENSYKKHKRIHQTDIFICFHCEEAFNSKKLLIKHINKVHEVPPEGASDSDTKKRNLKCYKCYKCGRAYTLEKVLLKHTEICDGIYRHSKKSKGAVPIVNKCENCNRSYTTRKILQAHLKKCLYLEETEEEKPEKVLNKCAPCNLDFESQENLTLHVQQQHGINIESPTVCKTCYAQFDDASQATAHAQNEHYTTPSISDNSNKKEKHNHSFTCDLCSSTFNTLSDYVEHSKNVHEIDETELKPYACTFCSARFNTVSNLNLHVRYHAETRSHICAFCGKGFLSKTDLNVHEQIHLNERSYKCEQCGKGFNTNKNLRTHRMIVHGDSTKWKYSCEICNKKFPLKTNYDVHVKRHKGVKEFECHICLKQFVSKGELIKHMTFHSNVRAYKCCECSKEYKDKSVLEIHLTRAHGIGKAKLPVKIRKHACHICPKAYYDKNKLTRHLYSHSGVKPFACSLCDKKFTDKSYLKQHLKVTHKVFDDDRCY